MGAAGYWLSHAFFLRRERFALSAMKAVAPRVVEIEASALGEAS